MIDLTTSERITVTTPGMRVAFIELPEAQLAQVTLLLEAQKIDYWIDNATFSIDGGPECTEIKLANASDAAKVQQLLDATPDGYENIDKMVLDIATAAMGMSRRRWP